MTNSAFLIALTFLSISSDGFVFTNDIDDDPQSDSLAVRSDADFARPFEGNPDDDLPTVSKKK